MKLKNLFISLLMIAVIFSFSMLNMNAVSADTIELEFWNLFTGGDGDFMDAIVDSFNEEHPDIYVDTTTLDWDEYYTGLITATAAADGPDVAVSHLSRIPDLVAQGLLNPITSTATDIGVNWDEFNESLLAETVIDDEYYAVPIDSHFHVFWYHSDYFEEAGLVDDDGELQLGSSVDEFLDALATVKEESDAEEALSYANAPGSFDANRDWWSFYRQQGGDIEFLNGESEMDLEKSEKALEVFMSLREEELMTRGTDYDESVSLFMNRRSAAVITGVWASGMFAEIDGVEVTNIPTLFDEPAYWGDSHALVIPYQMDPDPARMEAAVKFSDYVADKGLDWAEAGHVPSKDEVRELDEFHAMPFRTFYDEAIDYVAYDAIGEIAWTFRDVLAEEIANMFHRDDVTPEEAARRIKQQLDDHL